MSDIQAVLLHKDYGLNEKQALKYVKLLGYHPIKRVHETKNYYRYRIREPNEFKRFITKKTNYGITFVIGYE